jgi:2-polyprenyl-6-methoxyphenol hydroxylase-like FAD-dependent oxidoreductase
MASSNMVPTTEFQGFHSPTGIKVIIAGAGFAGLSLAIECIRNGHEVQIFEQAKEFAMLGIFRFRVSF